MITWPWQKQPQRAFTRADRNDLVRAQLDKLGDSGRKPRHVIHFAFPVDGQPAEPKERVKDSLSGLDIRFTETEDSPGVVFEHEREVASENFDEFTQSLAERFAAFGWEYDGWECAVEADEGG